MENIKGKVAQVRGEYKRQLEVNDEKLLIESEPNNIELEGYPIVKAVVVKVINGRNKGKVFTSNIEFLDILDTNENTLLLARLKNKMKGILNS
ncbi:hypothetical protein [Clostridium hydrogeniformans]|uniref:hypothetical protein n=1 Tax=Clostridium hydrogeniformans TaxID=349933 RepID=UPI000489AE03|nr:hypothetical protein [Clostridium hydrogeniformans]